MKSLDKELGKAVAHFWHTRSDQMEKQRSGGKADAGKRGTATGGKHADGFIDLLAAICRSAGLKSLDIHTNDKTERTLPGFFRPTKEWDVVVRSGTNLVAVVEVKSQVGSFGNNFNNRVEEALGNATDFQVAYREGLFQPSAPPWLGYFFMLEEHPTSIRPKRLRTLEPFRIVEEFQNKSYAELYERCCLRLVRERLYDAACFFTSSETTGLKGKYREPNPELGIETFAALMRARVAAFSGKR
jgi:Restriction endonuclease XhoI